MRKGRWKQDLFPYLHDEIQNIYAVSVHARIISPSLYCPHVKEIEADKGV